MSPIRRRACPRGRGEDVANVVTENGKYELTLAPDAAGSARRTEAYLFFDGVDITASMKPYLLSVEYMDNADGETDDLQIRLQDRDELWAESWLADMIDAAALPVSKSVSFTYDTTKKKNEDKTEEPRESNFRMQALIVQRNWAYPGEVSVLDCGEFFLDEVTGNGPPNVITLKGSSAPYRASLRQTQVSQRWQNIYLSGIAQIIADRAKLRLMNLLTNDPWIDISNQEKESDAQYLARLCRRFDVSLKFTSNAIVLYAGDVQTDAAPLDMVKSDLTGYDFTVGKAQQEYDSCRVSYVRPNGQTFSGMAYKSDYDPDRDENLHLELSLKCSNDAEARQLAAYQLDRHNRYAMTATISMAGNQRVVGGVDVRLTGFGLWSGLWAVSSAKHVVTATGGYTTQADLRMRDST